MYSICIDYKTKPLNENLFAAKDAEPFYNKLGFVDRPSDAPGMKYEIINPIETTISICNIGYDAK